MYDTTTSCFFQGIYAANFVVWKKILKPPYKKIVVYSAQASVCYLNG